MKKALAMLLSAAMLLGLLCGCDSVTNPDGSDIDELSERESIKDFEDYFVAGTEMETMNILHSQDRKELYVLCNCIEGLLSNDERGALVAAIAESWGTEDGGENWTFNLRKDVVWVDYQGNEKAKCVAEDWLWGLEFVLNFHKNAAANISMPAEMIVGANDYYNYTKSYDPDARKTLETPEEIEAYEEEIKAYEDICNKYGLPTTPLTTEEGKALDLTIFKQMVGIEAPDEYTLKYHCVAPMPYFDTVATYNCLYPAAGALIAELGVDGFLACTNENMWYNGCYTITTYVQDNEKVLTKNPTYWDKNCTLFDTYTIKAVESLDVAYQVYQTGELDRVALSESNLKTIYDDESHEFHDQLCETRPTKYSYQIHLSYDKRLDSGDPDVNWNTAVANKAFRLSWYYGLDLTKHLARTNAINPMKCVNYTYTASGLCLTSDGTDYTKLVTDRLGIDTSADTIDRLDAEKAAAYKAQAMEELKAKGVEFPVTAVYYIKSGDQTRMDTAKVLKQIFSDCLGDDFVVMEIQTYVSSQAKEVRNPQLGSFYINGWGADYGDPQNYLGQEVYGMDNAYYAVAYSKINNVTDPDLIAIYKEFTDLVNKANEITDDLDARYNAYADAEAYMLENALVIPASVAVQWQLTHVNDYSKIYAAYGLQSEKIKNWQSSNDAYTTEDYANLEVAYNAGN